MKQETKELIKRIAKFIDKDKHNFILTSKGYGKYLEEVLTVLVEEAIDFEVKDNLGKNKRK